MAISSLETLRSSISQFNLLSPRGGVKDELIQSYYVKNCEMLDVLKPIFDDVVYEISPDERLIKMVEELDAVINEARVLIQSWNHTSSKIYFVLQIESVISKLHSYSLEICRLVNCVEKVQHMHFEQISCVIEDATREVIEKNMPKSRNLADISKSLSLSTNQELLMEGVALEKLKIKAGNGEDHIHLDHINMIIALVDYMHNCLVEEEQLHSINGVPIPAVFCCPLSLQLMSDPVIVESGQTYERAFIRKWLDRGFDICPKTHQTLGSTNLIPNYTVKTLIASWCESNGIKLPDPIKSLSLNLPSASLGPSDSNTDGRSVPHSGNSMMIQYPRLPEFNQSRMNSCKDSNSSNGSYHDSTVPDKPMSPHRWLSAAPSLQAANHFETDTSRLSLATSEEKASNFKERHVSLGGQSSNQTKEDIPQASNVNKQFQGHKGSEPVSSGDDINESGEATLEPQVSSDSAHYNTDALGEFPRVASPSTASQREPEPRPVEAHSRSHPIWGHTSHRLVPRIIPTTDSRPDLSVVETQVRKLVEDLKRDSVDVRRAATAELRLFAKRNMENRIVIANCGAISLLVDLLYSSDPQTQENAVTALLNLSINGNNKTAIANASVVDPLIHVLETGNPEAKENSAATLFNLSGNDEIKAKIGRSGAIRPLVELIETGTLRGKKDAATALFNLSILHENKARIVQGGAVKHLVKLMDPAAGMVDTVVGVLANLSTIPEGRSSIGNAGGIPLLVEVVELGSARGKENAAAALLQFCTTSSRFCNLVLQEGAGPPLVALTQSGTQRAKEKAQALLSQFRNQRHRN
ncbi:U-box domain-containing protein 4-like [Typha latifolia]|uniref:U-box domain-containing protein 4-like n=1 Tax=Typha latifolia TaxID=4733 RepID=UPI003C2B7524